MENVIKYPESGFVTELGGLRVHELRSGYVTMIQVSKASEDVTEVVSVYTAPQKEFESEPTMKSIEGQKTLLSECRSTLEAEDISDDEIHLIKEFIELLEKEVEV